MCTLVNQEEFQGTTLQENINDPVKHLEEIETDDVGSFNAEEVLLFVQLIRKYVERYSHLSVVSEDMCQTSQHRMYDTASFTRGKVISIAWNSLSMQGDLSSARALKKLSRS